VALTTASDASIDGKYYEVIRRGGLRERFLIRARDVIYEDFLAYCRPSPSSKILDVGVSDVINDGANVLERRYPFRSRITAVGLGEAREFQSAFPEVTYLQIAAGHELPFADQAFEIATSNAVLEHVGSIEKQRSFLQDLLRVAKKVFVTVPNRFFPIEHHTGIPFCHYSHPSFCLACGLLGKAEWADFKNLILMSRRSLSHLLPAGTHAQIAFTGLKLGLFSSNLLTFIER
jgi:Methyltransferase domain